MLEVILSDSGEQLDVPIGTELTTSKAMDRVDEISRITQEAALSISLPATVRNRRLLAVADPTVLSGGTFTFPVTVLKDGQYQDISSVRTVSYSEREGYELEPYAEDWQDGMEATLLSDIDLGGIEWTYSAVAAAWSSPIGEAILLPLLADFGGELWREADENEEGVDLRDLRIAVSIYHILRLAFNRIGWNFVCPHLKSGDGRAWYAYLLGERWHYYPGKVTPWVVRLETNNSVWTGSSGMSAVSDESDRWGDITYTLRSGRESREVTQGPYYRYRYGGQYRREEFGVMDIELDYDLTVEPPPAGHTALLRISVAVHRQGDRSFRLGEVVGETSHSIIYDPDGQSVRHTGSVTFELRTPLSDEPIEGETDEDQVLGYSVRISYSIPSRRDSGSGLPGFSSSIFAHHVGVVWRPDPPYYSPGSEVRPVMTSEVTALELLQGVAHLMNAKLSTNLASRTVSMDVPFSYLSEVDGTQNTIPAYFQRSASPFDFRALTVPGSLRWVTDPNELQNRYILYDFVSSNDEAVTTAERSAWQRKINTGRRGSEVDERRNPLFEPTAEHSSRPSETGGPEGIRMLRMWDSERGGSASLEIAPRVFNYWGMVAARSEVAYLFEGGNESTYPYFSMAAPGRPYSDQEESDGPAPLVWKGYPGRDLYSRFYEGEKVAREDRSVEILLNGGDQTYDAIDFRRLILIRHGGSDILIQPTAVRDHPRGSRLPVLVEGHVIK